MMVMIPWSGRLHSCSMCCFANEQLERGMGVFLGISAKELFRLPLLWVQLQSYMSRHWYHQYLASFSLQSETWSVVLAFSLGFLVSLPSRKWWIIYLGVIFWMLLWTLWQKVYLFFLSRKTQTCNRSCITLVRCNQACIWMDVIENFIIKQQIEMEVLFGSYLDCLVTVLFKIGCLLGELLWLWGVWNTILFGMVRRVVSE